MAQITETNQLTVMVTGGSGYLGSVVCHKLVEQGHNVINIDRDRKKREMQNVTLYPFDIGNPQVDGIIQLIRPDVIIHLAASTHPASSMSDPGAYYQNNVGNTISLMQSAASAGVKNVIFASSSSVYGESSSLPTIESQIQQPLNPYGRSKVHAEQVLWDFAQAHDISIAILRFFSIGGADIESGLGYHHSDARHLIPSISHAAQTSTPLIVYGDGAARRDFTHVLDAAKAVVLAQEYLTNGGKSDTFNIASGIPYTVDQVLDVFAQELGVTVTRDYISVRDGEAKTTHADISKARKVLNWTPEYTITEIVEHSHLYHTKKFRKRT